MSTTDYQALAKKIVQKALKRGAKEAEAYIEVGRNADARVRDGEIEDLTQATSKGVGLRVFVKNRVGFVSSSDFSPAALDRIVERAIELAEVSAPNPFNGLPSKKTHGKPTDVGALFDEKVASLPADWKIKAALEMEKVIRSVDPRIKTVETCAAGESVSEVYFASSGGLQGSYAGTTVYLYAAPVASEGDQLQTAYWYDGRRFLEDLGTPESVGRRAAERSLRVLGAKKVKSQKCPVVFDPYMTAAFISNVAEAASGDDVFRKSSFLASQLGKRVAPAHVNLVDDGVFRRGINTAPFDGEGVPTRRTPIINAGVLEGFLYDEFTARKAKTRSTGSASRTYRNLPSIGTTNLMLEPGTRTPEEIIREIPNGLYVTSMLGHGANTVTGDYSRGANGLWIENGELTRPVQEITVGGNLNDMLRDMDAVGNDLTFHASTAAPTIRFRELTISGE